MLTLEELRLGVSSGAVDTVALALVDMQGRLQGKRLHAPYFLDAVVPHGSEACDYLLAVDVDMNTVDGYAMSSWERGYGDIVLVPDLSTLRRLPWQPGTVLVQADVNFLDGTPVPVSPRQILRRQTDALAAAGLVAYAGTELEFCVFRESYEDAWRDGYRNLTPANLYNVDYSLLGTARVEPLLRRLRIDMAGAGLRPESAKGECNLGQHEVAFQYDTALRTADNHSVYKQGAKEIAAQLGLSLTFMAKPNQREGNSCHIHFSLRDATGTQVMASSSGGLSRIGEHVVAGLLAGMADLTLLYAPNINSYKRYRSGSFAPTAIRWGVDNRTCALRLVGHGASLRVENRVPGGDVNPYLALAGMMAAARYGLEHELPLEDPVSGNAYADTTAARVPTTLAQALARWESSDLVASAFGGEVVAHYANAARVELAAFESAVTDWEMYRGFERL
jgi:glutamine synthetase